MNVTSTGTTWPAARWPTLIVFTSDNGGFYNATSNAPLRAVPCSTLDYFPTVLDLLGFKMPGQPEPLDGVSLVPLLEGRMAAIAPYVESAEQVQALRGAVRDVTSQETAT